MTGRWSGDHDLLGLFKRSPRLPTSPSPSPLKSNLAIRTFLLEDQYPHGIDMVRGSLPVLKPVRSFIRTMWGGGGAWRQYYGCRLN